MIHDKYRYAPVLMAGVGDKFAVRRERRIVTFTENFFTGAVGLDAGHLRLLSMLPEDNAFAARGFLPTRHIANGRVRLRRRAWEPSAFAIHRLVVPSRSDMKQIRLPSGDQHG